MAGQVGVRMPVQVTETAWPTACIACIYSCIWLPVALDGLRLHLLRTPPCSSRLVPAAVLAYSSTVCRAQLKLSNRGATTERLTLTVDGAGDRYYDASNLPPPQHTHTPAPGARSANRMEEAPVS